MSHLSIDRLTAVADDTPTPDEATHLVSCWDCRAEVAAYRRLARLSAMAPLPTEPLSAWSRLAPQLRAEGLLHDAGQAGGFGAQVMPLRKQAPAPWAAWTLRIAAGLALLAGGAAVGRMSSGQPLATNGTGALSIAQSVAPYQSPEEALTALNRAQAQYQSAAAFLARSDTSSRFIGLNQDSYRARLAALDDIAATTRAALYRAPQDPMLNQYYLTTLGAREATLREISATLPDSRRLEKY